MASAARFCRLCGTPSTRGKTRRRVHKPPPGAAAAKPVPPRAGEGVPPPKAASAIVATAASDPLRQVTSALGGSGLGAVAALPWQTIAAGQRPDLRSFARAGTPLAQGAIRSAVRQPALALLASTAIDLAVAYLGSNDAGVTLVAVRAVMGFGTAGLALVAGGKAGSAHKAIGIASLATGLVQTGSLLYTAGAGAIPSAIAQVASLVSLTKMAWTTLRRPNQ